MLQATWLRVAPIAPSTPPIVIANEEHRFLAAEQLRLVGVSDPAIVLEPVGRNTAPAIAAAALQAMAAGEDPLLLVLPSDHVVRDADRFRAAVEAASHVPVLHPVGVEHRRLVRNADVFDQLRDDVAVPWENAPVGPQTRPVTCGSGS